MKNERKTNIKVGVTTFAALILMLWILAWAKNVNVISDEKVLLMKFDSVAGLELGDQIQVNGVRKGYIKSINLKEDYVLVEGVLDFDTDLRSNAKFGIYMLDLMGGKKLEIAPGNSSTELDYSEIQIGKFNGDIATVMAVFSRVEGDLVSTIRDLRITLSKVNEMLSDDQFFSDVKESMASLEDMTLKISSVIDKNDTLITSTLNSSNKLIKTTEKILSENEGRFASTLDNMSSTLDSTKILLSSINKFSSEVSDKKNNLGRFLYDDGMLENIKITMDKLNSFLEILNEQIRDDGINVDANIF
ncbi:MAG: MlaD family protein [Melioribacteraceae bacterium]|nr:MlaD family protein [Melioribacteraceae bacterium]MCF8264924.1 MlaD family protein [Melioribacteraceae bacterium]MCF8413729.1 MlaD family protein [Melioribacteraceae bacterium]